MSRPRSTPPAPAARRRTAGSLATVAAATLVLLGAGVPAAAAHDELVGTVPAQDATVPAPPGLVELELSAPAQALGTRVLVTGPDGTPVSEGPAELRDTTVGQPLAADLPAGTYRVEWRVTSSDGHPLDGTFSFTVTGSTAAGGTAAADATPPAAPAPGGTVAEPPAAVPAEAAAPEDAAAVSPAALAVGAGLLVAAGALGARLLRRRS
ncbi:methionine-rich copper-binding protein CopC [Geodermatophilus bullaregiensis]|nr:methionine-rich copper-binding protein CopC [Geodermatophilus bullaregiensis]